MPTSKNFHQLYLTVDKNVWETFQRLYPKCEKDFIRRALKSATQSRENFDNIFFELKNV